MDSKTVLIADDEYGFRYPWIIYLKNHGFNVIEASNKTEVLENISKVDVLLMDVIFPDPDKREGIDIVREIRKNNIQIPVIFYSILNQKMCINQLKGINKYEWLQKPVELITMRRKISEMLGIKQ